MANVKNNASAQETKRRLIESAGEVFADVGYERATVKDITDRAGAAPAAINYHFSDKRELYYQVVRHAHAAGITAMQVLSDADKGLPPEKRLYNFIKTLLINVLDESRPLWHGILIAREMQQPTAATDRLIEENIRSYVKMIDSLMAEIVKKPVSREKMVLLTQTIIGQCVFYCTHKELHRRLYPDLPRHPSGSTQSQPTYTNSH